MASRIETFVIGVLNAFSATGLGIGVAVDGLATGWLFLAAFCAFVAVALGAKLGVLSAQQEGEHRG